MMNLIIVLLSIVGLLVVLGQGEIAVLASRSSNTSSERNVLSGPCPAGFYSGCSNRCYKLVQVHSTWDAARTVCRTFNADLAAISSNHEQACVTSYATSEMGGTFANSNKWIWIGLRKSTAHAAWTWTNNGLTTNYFNWDTADGEPNHPDWELCLAFHPAGWHDRSCSWNEPFYLCEANRLPAPSTTPASTTVRPLTCPTRPPCPTCATTSSPQPCPTVPPPPQSPLVARCTKGNLSVPRVELEAVESTTVQFIGDQSFKCRAYAYQLHSWIANLLRPQKSILLRLESGTVAVECRAKGVLTMSETDPDTAEAIHLTVNIASTKKCLEIFHNFWLEILKLR